MSIGRPRQPNSLLGRVRILWLEDQNQTTFQMFEKLKGDFLGNRNPRWLMQRIRQSRFMVKQQFLAMR